MTGSLSDEQKALIARLLSEGAALSAERLSQISSHPWSIAATHVEMLSIAEAITAFQADTSGHLGAHLHSQPPQSPIPLDCLALFPSRCAAPLSAAVAQNGGSGMMRLPDPLNAIIAEVANILCQSFIKVLADRLGAAIILSVPRVSMGSKSELLSRILSHIGSKRDAVVLSHVILSSQGMTAACSLILIFEADFLRKLALPR